MRGTGIVRKIDPLGRIILPIELRKVLNIDIADSLEIYVTDNEIMLKKYQPACIFCNNAKEMIVFKNKNICKKCISEFWFEKVAFIKATF